jgi:hypothetical protein
LAISRLFNGRFRTATQMRRSFEVFDVDVYLYL